MKPLHFVGSSLKDLKGFPDEVVDAFGFWLYRVQSGDTPSSAKPLKGKHLSGVYELKQDFDKNTYRAVYIAKLDSAVYVLHCFQKKSKSGIATPQKEIDLVLKRLKWAQEDNERST